MRPPQNAGGILSGVGVWKTTESCFNEAPAKRGGDLQLDDGDTIILSAASMRPPQNAGGIYAIRFHPAKGHYRFNEAPAKRGGD